MLGLQTLVSYKAEPNLSRVYKELQFNLDGQTERHSSTLSFRLLTLWKKYVLHMKSIFLSLLLCNINNNDVIQLLRSVYLSVFLLFFLAEYILLDLAFQGIFKTIFGLIRIKKDLKGPNTIYKIILSQVAFSNWLHYHHLPPSFYG